jgi:hypothetical protein
LSHAYRICGLNVASEVELPGVLPRAPAPADVEIRLGEVAFPRASGDRSTYRIDGDVFLLEHPGIARFRLTAGREIVVEPLEGMPFEDIAIFLAGPVFGVLLQQRGHVVLHASAVRVGDRAVLFCGPSGAGKSTIAAALGERGYAMLTDDLCVVVPKEGGAPLVQPDGRQHKLWAQAIDELGVDERRGDKVRSKLNKFFVAPRAAAGEPLPLGAIYVLRETRPPARDGIETANIVDASILVRANAFRPHLVRRLNQNTAYLSSAAGIAANAGVFVLNRPLDFAAMPAVIGSLEEHWRGLGLLGAGS